ncbi:MAG TPA: hypothetical protein VM754_12910, partial [Actinomycetota bacterium]|nr:hypothetical protein [Actinomycetota bacterium]
MAGKRTISRAPHRGRHSIRRRSVSRALRDRRVVAYGVLSVMILSVLNMGAIASALQIGPVTLEGALVQVETEQAGVCTVGCDGVGSGEDGTPTSPDGEAGRIGVCGAFCNDVASG